jgi:hypothetical protein
MLKLPAFKHFQFQDGRAVTVYQDDAKFWQFYLLPDFPQVRQLPGGDPVFMLIEYKLSDQSREADPSLPRGGGYLVFDAELRVEPQHRTQIERDLQDWVNAEWERLKRLPDTRIRELRYRSVMNDTLGAHWRGTGHEGTPRASDVVSSTTMLAIPERGTAPIPMDQPAPKIQIGEPLWTSGVVKMNAPQSAGLVAGRIAERKASLVGNNVAAFSIDLTTDGATLMRKTLVGADGSGATDLTPIQVEYNLKMLVKLPPASLYIKFDTASVYHALQELFHEHTNCTDDYFTSETMMSTAIESGLITVKVDFGGITDSELQETLMQQALQQTRQLLTDRFAAKERAPLEEWADSDVAESSREIYRLKRVQEIDMTSFEMTMEIEPTTEYEVAPQGTLATFLRGRRDMTAFVRQVDLDSDFFKTLDLRVRAFANWAEDDVAFVEVEVQYKQGREHKVQSFTFTPQDTEPKKWDPALVDGKREYEYRWRVGFEGRGAGSWSRFERSSARNLNVAVETPGKIQVDVTGVGLDFENVVDAVLVHMRYSDRAHGVDEISHSVLLTEQTHSGSWSRLVYAPWDEPIEYRVEYLLKSGKTVEQGWKKTSGPTRNLLVTRPDIDVLDLTLIPAGNWEDTIQAALSLRYDDGDYHRDAQFNFKASNEFKKWAVLMLDPRKRTFQYRVLATFKNGDVQETEWLTREGDQALPVIVDPTPRLTVKLTGAVLDYASTPLVKVDLEYKDPQGGSDVETFSLQNATDVYTWSVRLREGGPRQYRYKITYYPIEGNPVERDWVTTTTELVVTERYSIPKVGAEVNPVLQSFERTPAVEVDLRYDDPGRRVHERMTLVFTSKERQAWFVPVVDEAPRAYVMTITWYFADGAQVTSNPLTLDKPAVILPPPPKHEEV